MIPSRSHVPSLVLGAVVALSATNAARAAEPVGAIERVADRCASFGNEFVDMGNGVCGRVTRHVRIYVRPMGALTQNSTVAGWGGGTSSAAMRTYEQGMLPGAEVTQHLRVHGSLDSYSPFR